MHLYLHVPLSFDITDPKSLYVQTLWWFIHSFKKCPCKQQIIATAIHFMKAFLTKSTTQNAYSYTDFVYRQNRFSTHTCQPSHAMNWQHNKPDKSEAMEEVGGWQGDFVMTSAKARGLKTVSGTLPHISGVYIQGGWQILDGILRRAKKYLSLDKIWCLNLKWQLEIV